MPSGTSRLRGSEGSRVRRRSAASMKTGSVPMRSMRTSLRSRTSATTCRLWCFRWTLAQTAGAGREQEGGDWPDSVLPGVLSLWRSAARGVWVWAYAAADADARAGERAGGHVFVSGAASVGAVEGRYVHA